VVVGGGESAPLSGGCCLFNVDFAQKKKPKCHAHQPRVDVTGLQQSLTCTAPRLFARRSSWLTRSPVSRFFLFLCSIVTKGARVLLLLLLLFFLEWPRSLLLKEKGSGARGGRSPPDCRHVIGGVGLRETRVTARSDTWQCRALCEGGRRAKTSFPVHTVSLKNGAPQPTRRTKQCFIFGGELFFVFICKLWETNMKTRLAGYAHAGYVWTLVAGELIAYLNLWVLIIKMLLPSKCVLLASSK
jgi:hypothetical protein